MGGNAIKAAKRLNRDTFETYVAELKLIFPLIIMEPVKFFREKRDFGDIDIVVMLQENTDLKKLVLETIKPDEHYDNGPYLSFLYKDAQVDFIFMPPQFYQSALDYFAYNDVGNFIGRVARSMNFKYGHDGLSYEEHISDNYKISVHVSSDMQMVLDFLGYDDMRWAEGFDTIEEILEYGASSKYFNALYFDLAEQSNQDRVRNKKRKMYQNMLAYIQEKGLHPKPKLTAEERAEHFFRAVDIFGNRWYEEVIELRAKYEDHLDFKTLFNGLVVSQLTGLREKELGAFMSNMKKTYPDLEQLVRIGRNRVVEALVTFENSKRH